MPMGSAPISIVYAVVSQTVARDTPLPQAVVEFIPVA
jgi:hypothetical protein